MEQICEAIISSNNKHLKKIWLNRNLLTCRGVFAFKKAFFESNNKIAELYLGWNNIWNAGGKALAEILLAPNNLKVVDVSWNTIGSIKIGTNLKVGELGTAWGQVFETNTKLLHLDISFNKIGKVDSEIMS